MTKSYACSCVNVAGKKVIIRNQCDGKAVSSVSTLTFPSTSSKEAAVRIPEFFGRTERFFTASWYLLGSHWNVVQIQSRSGMSFKEGCQYIHGCRHLPPGGRNVPVLSLEPKAPLFVWFSDDPGLADDVAHSPRFPAQPSVAITGSSMHFSH